MQLDRRQFLRGGLALGSLMLLPRRGWAEGALPDPGSRTLVLLHLNGGNDGLNTVIPYNDPLYRVLRPGIGIDRGQVRTIHESFGLHPALAGFEQRWQRERLAIVNGIGYPRPDYSHFRATEIYYTAEPDKTPTYGWLGRALDARPNTRPVRAVALGREKPLSLQADSQGIVTMTDFSQFQLPANAKEAIALYETSAREEGVRGAVARKALEAFRLAERIAKLRPAGGGFYGSLGNDLGKALSLLKADLDLEVIHLSLGGFDTHASQAGAHNGLLSQVGNNLRLFDEEIEKAGLSDRVLTCVFSEFGRRPAENLSGGTDHGSAYPVFLLGGRVKPGMHGAYPSLEDLDDGNFRYTTDFRRLYAALLGNFLGTDPKPIVGDFAPLEVVA